MMLDHDFTDEFMLIARFRSLHQAPSQAFFTLSSASGSSPETSPTRSDHTHRKESKKPPEDSILIDSGEESPVIKTKKQKTVKTKPNQKLKEGSLITE